MDDNNITIRSAAAHGVSRPADAYSKSRRNACRAAGRCICGPITGTRGNQGIEHGPPIEGGGGRCLRCTAVHYTYRNPSHPRTVACSVCQAEVGQACRSDDPTNRPHIERIIAAYVASMGPVVVVERPGPATAVVEPG